MSEDPDMGHTHPAYEYVGVLDDQVPDAREGHTFCCFVAAINLEAVPRDLGEEFRHADRFGLLVLPGSRACARTAGVSLTRRGSGKN